MSLRFSLLALLSARPMTGYDLMRYFDDSVAFIWHAPHTQIYPELRRMEEEGLLDSEPVPRGPRGTKRAYSLTDAGFGALRHEASTVRRPSRERDPYRLRASYLDWTDPIVARRHLRAHIEHFAQWRDAWTNRRDALDAGDISLLQERLSHAPEAVHEAIVSFKVYAYEGLIDRAMMEIAWAERGLALIDELIEAGWAGPPRPRSGPTGAGSGGASWIPAAATSPVEPTQAHERQKGRRSVLDSRG